MTTTSKFKKGDKVQVVFTLNGFEVREAVVQQNGKFQMVVAFTDGTQTKRFHKRLLDDPRTTVLVLGMDEDAVAVNEARA